MERYLTKPDITMYPGIVIDKNTKLEYKNDKVEQTLENLQLKSKMVLKTDNMESEYNTTLFLNEGDVLIFEEEDRGYIKPVEEMYTIEQAIKELECIK